MFRDLSPAWLNRLPEPVRAWVWRTVPRLRKPVRLVWGDPAPRSRRYLTSSAEALLENGFAQAVMVAFHPEEIERTIAVEERALSRRIGAKPCPGRHGIEIDPALAGLLDVAPSVPGPYVPCPSCGAAV